MSENFNKRKIINRVSASAIILFWLAFTAVFFFTFTEKQVYPILYKEEIIAVSEKYGIDPALVFAIVRTESGFAPHTVSAKGATGLMQIMPSTGKYIADKKGVAEYDLFEVSTNLDFGCYYWKYLSERFYGLTETAEYVKKIYESLERYRKLYAKLLDKP